MQNRTSGTITACAFLIGIAMWSFVYVLMQPLALTTQHVNILLNVPTLSINKSLFDDGNGTGIREHQVTRSRVTKQKVLVIDDHRSFWERNEMICDTPSKALQQGTGNVLECELRKK